MPLQKCLEVDGPCAVLVDHLHHVLGRMHEETGVELSNTLAQHVFRLFEGDVLRHKTIEDAV